ncbi:hypothetical protein ABW19_dt0200293 [Dactylella cylindrospora]|nr:hypothetical protein ABW19_dt0200293 [Dactylella cylindrospora]
MSSAGASLGADPLTRWSILIPPKPLPPVDQIKSLCIVDFDNTLYQSPLPSSIWERDSVEILFNMDHLLGGGWWQTASILDATVPPENWMKRGLPEAEIQAKFPSRWNKDILDIARAATSDPQTLNVLLTGRNRKLFSKTILKILGYGKVDFDMVVLKQNHPELGTEFKSTMDFKQNFLTALLEKFTSVDRVDIYEDRVSHQKQLIRFGSDFNQQPNVITRDRDPVIFDVIHVAEKHMNLDPLEEIKQVKVMLRRHNKMMENLKIGRKYPAKMFKRVLSTGYMLSPETSEALLERFPLPFYVGLAPRQTFANSMTIKPTKCRPFEIEPLGGLGARVEFEVTGVGSFNNSIWAVRIRPTDPNVNVRTRHSTRAIVLAKTKGTNWGDVDKISDWEDISRQDQRYMKFTTTIGEQILLSISATPVGEVADGRPNPLEILPN